MFHFRKCKEFFSGGFFFVFLGLGWEVCQVALNYTTNGNCKAFCVTSNISTFHLCKVLKSFLSLPLPVKHGCYDISFDV